MYGAGKDDGAKRNGELTYRFVQETLSRKAENDRWSEFVPTQKWGERLVQKGRAAERRHYPNANIMEGGFRDEQQLSRVR